ncbi:MAG: hypothetical protein WAQ99_01010 [Pyrinomonadaceae bacterium]
MIMSVSLALNCSANTAHREISRPSLDETKAQEPLEISRRKQSNIKNTKGVVVLSKFVRGDFVRIYNGNGSLWYEFSYFYDDSDGKFDYPNDDFRPFAFHVDNFLLALKCTKRDDSSLEVIVNEETGLRKYVKADDPVLKLEEWDKFVLGVFAVTFDQNTNPLLEGPNDQTKKIAAPKSAIFRPVETRGNWLKVSWQSVEEQRTETVNGWIRWRNDETLLIDLSFFA